MAFDELDLRIIRILQNDARTSFTQMAKILGVSPSVIQIRFNNMKKRGLILGTTLELNPEKFGVKYRISAEIKALEPNVDEVIKFVNNLTGEKCRVVAWPVFGCFNISALIMSRNLLEAHKIRQSIKEHPSVIEVSININIGEFTRNYNALKLENELKR